MKMTNIFFHNLKNKKFILLKIQRKETFQEFLKYSILKMHQLFSLSTSKKELNLYCKKDNCHKNRLKLIGKNKN